jgi:hypothetical protein
MSITFICGSHRSGTTSLLRVVELSREAHCQMEPSPNLNLESRYMFEGFLQDPFKIIVNQVAPRVASGLARCKHYVEKQNSLVPFIPSLYKFFGCKFLIPIRDGRDVVPSLLNWHYLMYPIIYQECREAGIFSEHAQGIRAAQKGVSEFDYSLPRPLRGDPSHGAWNAYSRMEMVSWYWNFINEYLENVLKEIPPANYMLVDYTKPSVETLHGVYKFIGLDDFDSARVEKLLRKRINSLEDRGERHRVFPRFLEWKSDQRQRFYDLAWPCMKRFGFSSERLRPRPEGYAPSPMSAGDEMIFRTWCAKISNGMEYETVLIPGDADLTDRPGEESGDIVGYLAGLEGCHDIDAHLRIAASRSQVFLYIAANGGYQGLIKNHRYLWKADQKRFCNVISVRKATDVLREEGYVSFATLPGPDGKAIIIGSREALRWEQLVADHPISVDWQPYVSKESKKDLFTICQEINIGCHYLSVSPMDVANSLDYFDEIARELAGIRTLRAGKMADFVAGRSNLGLRVDVDMDFVAFAGMVEIAKKHRLNMSGYVLHTAPYYGSWEAGIFRRNESVAGALRQFEVQGIEIGLHLDPYLFYHQYGVDGAHAVREELTWLRSQGLRVEGVSGHNCVSTYGVESSEIFRQWAIRSPSLFCHDYLFAPVGELDANELGIIYEAGGLAPAEDFLPPDENQFVKTPSPPILARDPGWMRKYLLGNGYCRWVGDYQLWVIGKDLWVVAARIHEKEIFKFGLTWADILQFLSQMPQDLRGTMTLHPAYFGYRESSGSMPIGMPPASRTLFGLSKGKDRLIR